MNPVYEIVDHTKEALAEFDRLEALPLKAVARQAEAYAKLNVTDASREGIDLTQYGEYDNSRVSRGKQGGQLRNSITGVVKDGFAYIGSNIPYAPYHELGTGIYASEPGGRRSPWAYYNQKLKKWMMTRGLYPLHFLKNAVANHLDEYERIVKDIFSNR